MTSCWGGVVWENQSAGGLIVVGSNKGKNSDKNLQIELVHKLTELVGSREITLRPEQGKQGAGQFSVQAYGQLYPKRIY